VKPSEMSNDAPADETRIFHGVDVSVAQGHFNHGEIVDRLNLEWALVKSGEGNEGRVDKNYRVNIAGFLTTGIAVGTYIVPWLLPITGEAHREPANQIKAFWEASDGVGTRPGELPPMLDLEYPFQHEWPKFKCNPKQIIECMRICCLEAEQLWQRTPMIYSFPSWWNSVIVGGDIEWARRFPLVVANYQNKGTETLDFPPAFRPVGLHPWGKGRHTMHQWSGDDGVPVKGIGVVDRNVFIGTTDDFLRLCNRDPDGRVRAEIRALRDAGRESAITTIVEGVALGRKVPE